MRRAIAQDLLDGGGAVGGDGDVAEQLELLLSVVELTQAAFGDVFGLQPACALALESAVCT